MQFGLMQGRNTIDVIFLGNLQEKYLTKSKPFYLSFVGLEKTFDSLSCDVVISEEARD